MTPVGASSVERAEPRASGTESEPAPAASLPVLWALLGVATLLGTAVARLGRRGLETVIGGLAPGEWVALLLLTAAFVYGEGVVALQRRWIPRVVDRANALAGEPSVPLRVLAPLYGMSLVGAPIGRVFRAWLGVGAIVVAVSIVRALPEPWRGIVDFSVAAALGWALLVLLRAVLTSPRRGQTAPASGPRPSIARPERRPRPDRPGG